MGYKGVGNDTKIHYSNKRLRWKPICGTPGYRSLDDWDRVTCSKCLDRRKK